MIRSIRSLLAIALLVWSGQAEAQQGPVGQGLNEAGRAVKRGLQTAGQAVSGGLQTAGQAVSGGFQKTKNAVQNMEVVSRVYSRLHWDKAMTGANLEIEIQAGGVAILTGVVPSEQAKTKALVLTAETVGVNQVVDRMTIAAVGRPAPIVPGASAIIVTPPAEVVPPPLPTPKPKETDIPL
jgi:hyperosmotically inducible protein